MHEILAKSPVFKGLKPEEIRILLKRVRFRSKRYNKGQTVVFRGDVCDELVMLVKGSIRGEMLDHNGKIVEVETVSAPRPIAAAFLFGRKNIFPVDAVANEDLEVVSIPRDSLIYLMQLSPRVLTNYLDVVSNRTHFLTERLWFMSFKTIREKFAHYVLKLLKPGELTVILPKSQQELSQFFGVSRPSLSRVIGDLDRDRILTCHRREITVLNKEKLAELVE